LKALNYPISQRQGIQQLQDEVDVIHIEVADLRSKHVSLAQPPSSEEISDAASSPTPPRQIPDFNSPPESFESHLSLGAPHPLQAILDLFGQRLVARLEILLVVVGVCCGSFFDQGGIPSSVVKILRKIFTSRTTL
jgi:hypothetical protein